VRSIAVDGAHVLAGNGFRVGTVLVEGETIAGVAWSDDERRAMCGRAGEVVQASGTWLVPGLVDAHTHAYGTLLRGTENALPLELWAFYTIAYGYGLDDAAIRAAMLLHDAECIRSGITGVVDHFPHIDHAAAAIAAHEASGMRVLFAAFVQDISDYDLLGIDVPPALRELAAVSPVDTAAYAEFFAGLVAAARAGSGRVTPALGPNAPQRCSPAIWSLWRTLRDRHAVPVHAHALETQAQARIARERWPAGMIVAMDDAGLLIEGLSLAHAIWTTPAERERLARTGVAVVHNPLSNLTIGSGIMPLAAYAAAGVTVGLGTDASNCAGRHDLFETMRLALALPRIGTPDATHWLSAANILRMATTGGMNVLGIPGEAEIAAGRLADLVIVRRDGALNVMFPDTIEGFVAQAGREAVEGVMVGGRWVLRDGRILTFDEEAVVRAVIDAHAGIAERAASVLPGIDAAVPAVAAALAPWQIGAP
jgi:5-methylthioadenosine/S-adenosylhomocysteine deaminase